MSASQKQALTEQLRPAKPLDGRSQPQSTQEQVRAAGAHSPLCFWTKVTVPLSKWRETTVRGSTLQIPKSADSYKRGK